jgi:hypothetical protein
MPDTADVIEMAVNYIELQAIELERRPDFDWVRLQASDWASRLSLDESCIGIIDQRVRERIQVEIAGPKELTKRGRDNLLTRSELDVLDTSYYWSRYREYFAKTGMSLKVLEATNEATNRILQLTPQPKGPEFLCKGMVIGDVQAGKTGNYTALITKASDLGYRLIIVLTGVTENLRAQTQARLDKDFIGANSDAEGNPGTQQKIGVGRINDTLSKRPGTFTDCAMDFRVTPRFSLAAQNSPVLIVTKKNVSVLERIDNWLKSQIESGDAVDLPILVIDDEADNASVNTGSEEQEPKTINRLIRQVLARCKRVTYLAYTATPFANIFIDPDSQADTSDTADLYPSDFIIALQPPPNYCGGRFFFDEDQSDYSQRICEVISDAAEHIDLGHKVDFSPTSLPDSLFNAIDAFFLSAAIKDLRRARGVLSKQQRFDSMLINVSRFVAVQSDVWALIKNRSDSISNALALGAKGENSVLERLQAQYKSHYANLMEVSEPWEEVAHALIRMERPDVLVVHRMSEVNLDYSSDMSSKVIAIGGLKLSRGLTLEGLVVSYFYRRSMAYDTLMQMARWFGYRDGYKDLLRLWTTSDVADSFLHITAATEELKEFLVTMEQAKMEPDEFGIRVRSHPDALMTVTANNKMRGGQQYPWKLRYDDSLKETFFVDCRNHERERQIDVLRDWIAGQNQKIKKIEPIVTKNGLDRGYVFKKVAAADILKLLDAYQPHKGNAWARGSTFRLYLGDRADAELAEWDVVIQSNTDSKGLEPYDVGLADKVYPERRTTKLSRQSPKGADQRSSEQFIYEIPLGNNGKVGQMGMEKLGLGEAQLAELAGEKRPEKIRSFRANNQGNPLLVIHLISLEVNKEEAALNVRDRPDEFITALENVSPDKPFPALSISIPPADIKYEGVVYQLNKRAQKELFGDETMEAAGD